MPTIYYWSGLSQVNLQEFATYKSKINLLLRGNTKESDLDLKQHKQHPLYTIRLNQADRLLFTTIKKDGKSYILLLEIIYNHDYTKARFLKPKVLKNFLQINTESVYNATDASSYEEAASLDTAIDTEHEASQLQPLMRYKQQWLALSEEQVSTNQFPLPLILVGPPGSGKSCVALNLLLQSIPSNPEPNSLPTICLTASVHVKNHLEQQWQTFPEALDAKGNYRTDVRFLTYTDLLIELHGTSMPYVDKQHFEQWLTNYRKKPHIKAIAALFDDNEKVYQEFGIAAGMPSMQAYFALGVTQCLYTDPATRKHIWDALNIYQAVLKQEHLISISFSQFPVLRPTIHKIILDEAQDFNLSQLTYLNKLVASNQLALTIDNNQNVVSQFSVRPLITQYFHSLQVPITLISLKETYRCPPEALALVNGTLDIKNYLLTGTADKYDLAQVQCTSTNKSKGHVTWSQPPANPEAFRELIHTLQTQHGLKETEIAIIAPAHQIACLTSLINWPLTFAPEAIKGLEYPCIITFNPLSYPELRAAHPLLPEPGAELKTSPNRSKHRENPQTKFSTPLNHAFVAFSRTLKVLVVLQQQEYKLSRIVNRLKALVTDAPAVTADNKAAAMPETSTADWQAEIIRIYQAGNPSKAQELYHMHLHDQKTSFTDFLEKVGLVNNKAAAEPEPPPPPLVPFRNKKKSKKEILQENLKLLIKKLGISADESTSAEQVLRLIVSSKRAIIQLLLLLQSDEKVQKLFFSLLSPYFHNRCPSQDKLLNINYLQHLLIKLTKFPTMINIFNLFYPHLTAKDLNSAICGVPNVNDNSSLLLFFCNNRIELIIYHWGFLRSIISPEALHRPVGPGGVERVGMTPFYIMLLSGPCEEHVVLNWKYFQGTLNSAALHRPVMGMDAIHGTTPFYYLTTRQAGKEIIVKNFKVFKNFISIEDWNRPIPDNSMHGGLTPLFQFAKNNSVNLFTQYWEYFRKVINTEGLSHAVTASQSDLQGSTLFFNLCLPYGGTRIIAKYWNDFEPHLTQELLNQPCTAEHSFKGASPFYILCASVDGLRIIIAHWDKFRSLITTESLIRKVTGKGESEGESAIFHLCSHFLGHKLLKDNWHDFEPYITREVLIEIIQNKDFKSTCLHQLFQSRTTGMDIIDENFEFFYNILRTEDFSLDCEEKGTASTPYTPKNVLSSHPRGIVLLERFKIRDKQNNRKASGSLSAAQSSLLWSPEKDETISAAEAEKNLCGC